jgi:hypothetical protein
MLVTVLMIRLWKQLEEVSNLIFYGYFWIAVIKWIYVRVLINCWDLKIFYFRSAYVGALFFFFGRLCCTFIKLYLVRSVFPNRYYICRLNSTQFVWTMHKICKVWGSNPGHDQKKKKQDSGTWHVYIKWGQVYGA